MGVSGAERSGEYSTARLRGYYDALSRKLLFRRLFGAGEGAEHLTMHRELVDPDSPSEPPTPLVLEKLLDRAIVWPADGASFSGLDVGCGYGGVSLRLAQRRGGKWLGLTLSPVQAAQATRATRRLGLSDTSRYLARSYDAPFSDDETFDVAFAIESLIHSADKLASLANIAGALRNGASFVLVDDVAAQDPVPPDLQEPMAQFQSGWMAPTAPTEDAWRNMFAEAGLRVTMVQDLSFLMRPRTNDVLDALLIDAQARRDKARKDNRRAVIDGEIGGLALERLYNAKSMRYLMIAARKL